MKFPKYLRTVTFRVLLAAAWLPLGASLTYAQQAELSESDERGTATTLPAADVSSTKAPSSDAEQPDSSNQPNVAAGAGERGAEAEALQPESSEVPTSLPSDSGVVRFSFDRTPWRTVLEWLAREAELALHFNDLPAGTFTYSDPADYTPEQAIDRINMFLIPEGYSAVRSENLLSVINLQSSRSLQQLDSMARLVSADQLDELGDHDIVKSLFALGIISTDEASEELDRLQLLVEPIEFEASNQIMVTGTASKLRSVREVLDAMRGERSKSQESIRNYTLEYVNLEQFLEIARPHLGIDDGQTRGDDINISTGSEGRRLYVSATGSAFEVFEDLLEVIDQPSAEGLRSRGEQVLRSHRVQGDNLDSVYEVLQTMLAKEPIRLSRESATNSIVALADQRIHDVIDGTIEEMRGQGTEFEIINLETLDPYLAISLLDQMFDLSSSDDDDDDRSRRVKIDAEPRSRRLFVRGPKAKVEEIKTAIEKLDSRSEGEGQRVVPIFGSRAERVLKEAKSSWSGSSTIDDRPLGRGMRTEVSERVVSRGISDSEPNDIQSSKHGGKSKSDHETTGLQEAIEASNFVSAVRRSADRDERRAAIAARITSQGIVIESEDDDALANFERHVRRIANASGGTTVETVVYYLKYSTADDATRLLADLIDGASTVDRSVTDASLVNSYVPSNLDSSLFGSYLRKDEESTMVTSGTLTVVADSRLNRLICVGTSEDLGLVEQYLEVIDKDSSLTDIETRGSAHIIELENSRAEDVAEVVREAYGDRVAMSSEQRAAAQRRQSDQRRRRDDDDERPENNLQTSRSQEPQMSIAVHQRSNALVVTAPPNLFAEVESLIEDLDQKAEQRVEVLFYPSATGVETLREAITGERSRSDYRRRRRDRD